MHQPRLIAATVTPIGAKLGTVNTGAINDLVLHLIGQRLDGLYVGGSTGEAMYLDLSERFAVIEAFAEAAAGKLSLVAQVGGGSLAGAIELGRTAKSAGYEAISALPPMYYGHKFAAIKDFYQRLAEEVELPLIVYNFPAASGTDLSTSQLLELMSIPGVSGIKHTSLNLYQFERLIRKTDTFGYYGHDEQFLSALVLQPHGFIGSTIGIMPHVYRNIIDATAAGDLSAARNWQSIANDVIDVLIKVGVIPSVKAILAMDGLDCGHCRAPLGQPDDAELDLLRRTMEPVWQARNGGWT